MKRVTKVLKDKYLIKRKKANEKAKEMLNEIEELKMKLILLKNVIDKNVVSC